MYSWEIKDYIETRKGILTVEEAFRINNIKENPQLDHIISDGLNFKLWDNEGNTFSFRVAS